MHKLLKELKNFPLLRANFPVTDEEIAAVRKPDPLLYGEAIRLRELLARTESAGGREAVMQMMDDAFGITPDVSKDPCGWFSETIGNAIQRIIFGLVNEYLTNDQRDQFALSNDMDGVSDAVAILEIMRTRRHDSTKYGRRVFFEARRAWCLGLLSIDIELERRKVLEASQGRALDLLEREFFDPRPEDRITLIVFLDRTNHFRVAKFCVPGEEIPREFLSSQYIQKMLVEPVRYFDWEGMVFPVVFSARGKAEDSWALKQLRADSRWPGNVLDRWGLKFAFFDKDGFDAGTQKLRQRVLWVPGVMWKMSDNTDGEHNGARRRHTSDLWQARKSNGIIRGVHVEIQRMQLRNLLNERVGGGEENHSLRRLRQIFESVFPVLFPEAHYGEMWNPKMYDRLHRMLLRRIVPEAE